MGKMTNCKACGKEITKDIKKCVHCGKDQRNFFMKHKMTAIIVTIVVLAAVSSSIEGKSDQASPKTDNTSINSTQTSSSEIKKDNEEYSFDKFMQVQTGMTYDQVKDILGEGKEQSSSGDGDAKTISYAWKNSDGSSISIMLQGGRVVNKAQVFLKSMDAKVTLDQYNKVRTGMAYEQVKDILGEGQLSSQTDIFGSKSEIYEWINSNGSDMNVTFRNGKAESKAQFNLK